MPTPAEVAQYIESLRSMTNRELLEWARARYNVDEWEVPNWVHVLLQAQLRQRVGITLLTEGVGEPIG